MSGRNRLDRGSTQREILAGLFALDADELVDILDISSKELIKAFPLKVSAYVSEAVADAQSAREYTWDDNEDEY